MLLKKRLAKVSSRGLYLQDRELRDTVFEPGKEFRFVIDKTNRSLVILPADNLDGNNHVSKRRLKDGLKPVIDIRSQEAKDIFQDSDYLQVTIYTDRVLIEGFVEDNSLSEGMETSDESTITPARKISEIVLSIRDLKQAAELNPYSKDLYDFLAKQVQSTNLNSKTNTEVALDFVSLFAGAGLMDIGFLKSGFKCVYAIEKDPFAAENYRRNLGSHIICGDVIEIQELPDAPVIIAGSPCQDLSIVNSRRFLESARNQLIRKFIELIRSSKCKVFLLENVPQIITAGQGRFKDEILEALGDQFDIDYGVLDAADMGTAQFRKRAFFLGSKIGHINLPKPLMNAYKTVRDAFSGIVSSMPNQQDTTESSPKIVERMKHIRPGKNFLDVPESLMQRQDHFSNYCKRLDYDQPSVAIVNYRKTILIHPEEDRILSVREAARLQGVPDDYVFYGPLGQMQQQVANGVPVPLALRIAQVICEAIERYNTRLSYGFC